MKTGSSREFHAIQEKNRALSSENEQLRKIYEIGNTLRAERNIDKLLPLIMVEISKFLDADRATLFLVDLEKRQLWTKFAEGMGENRIYIGLKMGIVGACVLTGKLLNVASAYEDPYFNTEIDLLTGYRTESVLCAPIFNREREVVGVLEFLNKRTGVFTAADEQEVLKTVAKLAKVDFSSPAGGKRVNSQVYALRKALNSERCALFTLDRDKGELRSVIAEKIQGGKIQLNLNLGIAGLIAVTGQELIIPDAYADPRFDKTVDERTGYITRCILGVPLKNQIGKIIGVIEVMNKNNGQFTGSDLELLKSLSSFIAIFIENALLFEEHNQQFKSMIEVLAASIDAKDTMTAGHSKKVAEYSIGIARTLGFGEEEIDILGVAALLHDLGKLGTDDNILKKPGQLTHAEFEHIKEHVIHTRNILNKMTFMVKYRKVPILASSHHERLDGTGYSEGLLGNQIPFMARIIAVADVFEALTTNRHYRDAMPVEEAFRILDEGKGSKFDENVIKALKIYHSAQPAA